MITAQGQRMRRLATLAASVVVLLQAQACGSTQPQGMIATSALGSSSSVGTGTTTTGAVAATGSDSAGESSGAQTTGSSSGEDAQRGPYPIVFAHGFFGFNDFAGAGFVDYFWGVREDLIAAGEPEVFTPAVDPFNSSTVRGEQLLAAVQEVLEATGASRVNIIAHSQGGLDARFVAATQPELVASIVTVSTPHHGTPVADQVLALSVGGGTVTDALVQIFGGILWGEIDNETSLRASFEQLSSEGTAAFNTRFPNAASVAYYSIGGRSARHDGGDACATDNPQDFITRYNRDLDPLEPLFAASEAIADGNTWLAPPIANDGLVRVQDAKWGEFLGCIPADHTDQVGHLFGDAPGGDNSFDHHAFYRGVVEFVREQGF